MRGNSNCKEKVGRGRRRELGPGGQDDTRMLWYESPKEQVRMENSRQLWVKTRENWAQAPGRGTAEGVRLGWMGQKILHLVPSQEGTITHPEPRSLHGL